MLVAKRASMGLRRAFAIAGLSCLLLPAVARAQSLQSVAAQLGSEDRKLMQDAIVAIGQRTEPAALAILQALKAEQIRISAEGQVLILDPARQRLVDPISGATVKGTPGLKEPLVTNAVRRSLETAVAQLQLRSRDRDVRLEAADVLAADPTQEMTEAIRAAVRREKDAEVKKKLAVALAQLDLQSSHRSLRLAATQAIAKQIGRAHV